MYLPSAGETFNSLGNSLDSLIKLLIYSDVLPSPTSLINLSKNSYASSESTGINILIISFNKLSFVLSKFCACSKYNTALSTSFIPI